MNERLRLLRPGRVEYRRAYALQKRLVEELIADRGAPGALLVLEHEPAVTLGRASRREHLLASDAELRRRGVELIETDRGGDVTWHGPGQMVVYPILPLERFGGRDLGRFLRRLEEVVIRTLGCFGVRGAREAGLSGVWTGRGKIAALGVAFRRWVSFHGLSLNLDPDMGSFDLIVPCGLRGRKVTSLRELLGDELPEWQVVERALVGEFCAVFGVGDLEEVEMEIPPPLEPLAGRRGHAPARAPRHPPWLVKRLPADPAGKAGAVGAVLAGLGLNTVCRAARCPNLGECFARGTATFLVLGPSCSRRCRFCAVDQSAAPAPLDPEEPRRVAEAAARLALGHVVVTSVTRDDLADGGAGHLAATVRAVRERLPGANVEVLVPDFAGRRESLATVLAARPDVLNHNVETVPRLYPEVRPGADYRRSLELLGGSAKMAPRTLVKSGLMVGLGERPEEVRAVLADLAGAGVGAVTVGQYLAPTPEHHPVAEFVRPEQFEAYARAARALGLAAAECGPWVRSSYHAEHTLAAAKRETSEEPCALK